MEVTEEDQEALLEILSNTIDLAKVIGMFNPNKAEEFKKRNGFYYQKHIKGHNHDSCSTVN